MMSYFRSAGDISESTDLSVSQDAPNDYVNGESYNIGRVRTIGSSSNAGDSNGLDTSETFSPSSAPASFHTNALLHALLEERCMLQAMTELQARGSHVESIHHPEVQALGSAKYSRTIQNLGDLNIVKPGIDNQYYSPVRQGYRDAVDLLADQNAPKARPRMHKAASQLELQLPQALRRYHDASPLSTDDVRRQLGTMTMAGERQKHYNIPSHKLVETKYVSEFEEFSMLGKGGYGVVFHVRNKLDGGAYAIKKIPMSNHRIRRIQENGQLEMDHILLELRTLARLNHPNVVRYHTGWIEYATFSTQKSTSHAKQQRLLKSAEESSESEADDPSVDIQFQFDDDEENSGWGKPEISEAFDDGMGIVFEDSEEKTNEADHHSNSLSIHTASYPENPLEKLPSRSTLASVDDEVEVIPRMENSTSTSQTDASAFTNGGNTKLEPCLALHIQMSLYSMTLADFLSPTDGDLDSSAVASLRHCFHPSASLDMTLAIMEGVRYLHKEEIVHRDLKPGNVFLAVRPGSDCPPGAIDLSSCHECNSMASTRPFNMDICLGDFGLVSAIAKAEDASPVTPSRIVGTEIYRPENVTRDNHPRLDVYALGIIVFELFWSFGTKMERHAILQGLKKGQFPDDFEVKVGCVGLKSFIESMVLATDENCPTWASLRQEALRLKDHCKA